MKHTDKDRQSYLKKLNAFAAELIGDTAKSTSLLREAGIVNSKGDYTARYRSMSVCCVQDKK
jgi:hypothetical protein